MELRQLRYFVRVVEQGSMSRAALDLDVVQSALSQQITRLESELATRLLQRTPRGVTPTEAGLAFFREAQLTLRHADQAVRAAQQATGARRWDMAPLLEEDLFLICARARGEGPGHPRGRQLPKTITVAELVQEPLILPTGPHGLRSTLDTAFARDRVAPHVVLEVDSLAMVMAAVDAGQGSTVQPWVAMGRYPDAAGRLSVRAPHRRARAPRQPAVQPARRRTLARRAGRARGADGLCARTGDDWSVVWHDMDRWAGRQRLSGPAAAITIRDTPMT